MTDDRWKLGFAELYLITIAAEEAWNSGTLEEREERIAELYIALIEMLNGMAEKLLATLPEADRDKLFERARERISGGLPGGGADYGPH